MSSSQDDTIERSAEHWRRLAQQTLVEAEIAMDPEIRDVLKAIARDYTALAQKAEARGGLPATGQS